jgi:2-oxo-4-hydroxy-4-carboxy-5-ureidoimidazoline decarboxylase
MRLEEFNAASDEVATAELTACCASPVWAARVAGARPFASVPAVVEQASAVLAELAESEIDLALAGHPRIGERSTHAASRREQGAVATASTAVLDGLAAGNRAYEERFGHVYLVCADGRPADELLAVLNERLGNDAATERRVLRGELARINAIRLYRMFDTPIVEDPTP